MTKVIFFFFVLTATLMSCSSEEDCIYSFDDICLNSEYLEGQWSVQHFYIDLDKEEIVTIRQAQTEFFPDGASFSFFVDNPEDLTPDSSFYKFSFAREQLILDFDNFYKSGQGLSTPAGSNLFVYKSEDMFEVHNGQQDTIVYDPAKLAIGESLEGYLYIFTRK